MMHEHRRIPQTDPKAGYLARRDQINAAIARVLDSGWYILGEETANFEREFAGYVGVPYALGVASGTDALEVALRTLGVGVGDGVITVSCTAVATVAAIERCGATPILIDVDDSYVLSPQVLADTLRKLDRKSSSGIAYPRAVIPVHLYGYPADMSAIMEIARRYELYVVEDCAQAHGAAFDGRKCGAWGDMAAFSFYPTKNLGALGDGGMVVCSNHELAEKARALREYGWRQRNVSDIPGVNSRLDEVQSAVLRTKLPFLDTDNERRRQIAEHYGAALEGGPGILPPVASVAHHVYHQFVVRTEQRDELRVFLNEVDIGTAIHYPVPVHLQPAYLGRSLLGEGGLARTEKFCQQFVSLPMYPQLSVADVERICQRLQEWTL